MGDHQALRVRHTRLQVGRHEPAASVTLTKNGDAVSQGTGADCLGSPLTAALWLASTLAGLSDPLRAGDVVLTGALGPMVAAAEGDVFTSRIEGLGSVGTTFGSTTPEEAGA